MYDDFYQMYLEELEAVAEAGPEEELSLLERLAAGDVSARERLIEGNLKRVLEYAKEYDGRGLPMGDLVQEGNMALTALAMEYESGAFQELLRERVRACIEAALEEQRMEADKRPPGGVPGDGKGAGPGGHRGGTGGEDEDDRG